MHKSRNACSAGLSCDAIGEQRTWQKTVSETHQETGWRWDFVFLSFAQKRHKQIEPQECRRVSPRLPCGG
jgi:hypothetical protein